MSAKSDRASWRDLEDRIVDLWPGRHVRVVPSTCGGVGDVLLDGRSADAHERAAMRRALPGVRFPRWPRGCGYVVTMAGEVACGAVPGRTSAALGGVWPAAERGPVVLQVKGGV